MFGYPDLDGGWNVSWFLGVMAFPKPMRHSTLNNRNSWLETMATTIVIVLRTIQERQIFSNCSCYCSSITVSFVCYLLVHTFQVIGQYSREISVLYYSLHSWHRFPWFEISNEIERRFYQEVLSPDLKWRKQGLASLGRFCLLENAISSPNREVFKTVSKPGYPNVW